MLHFRFALYSLFYLIPTIFAGYSGIEPVKFFEKVIAVCNNDKILKHKKYPRLILPRKADK